MMEKIKYGITTVAILTVMPVLAMAKPSENAQKKITSLCKSAIEKKGYGGYTYKYVDVDQARSGNYSMLGQLHKDAKRYEFNCVLNKDIESLKIEDLVINSLD